MNRKRKNPLIKRIPKELIMEWRKYLVVSLFLTLTIGFVSGMYVANGSMTHTIEDSVDTYHLEDGHFELHSLADQDMLDEIQTSAAEESVSVTIYENFYRNETEDIDGDGTADGNVRIYKKTDYINQACLMEGALPSSEDEIAIDRMHADNAGISVGDTISVSGNNFTVTGLIAYVNYSTLHEKNTDPIFDALKFNVAMVTDAGFDRLSSNLHYAYAWSYENPPADNIQAAEMSDTFLETLVTQTMLFQNAPEDYLPRYANAAVNFARDDMGGDMAVGGVLLYVLIIIIAFIFAVTITNTIYKEAGAIGTLRALGYTKGELIRHYLSMPIVVTLISAVVGNLLGYTLFRNIVASMYYNSYSLPTYETIWNSEAFIKTTFIPIVLMFLINLLIITKHLQLSPLQFLRHDFKKQTRKKAMRLPNISFFGRFRLRIILQNLPNYLILFIGVLFVSIMLSMAVGMPATLNYYQENTADMMFSDYQYLLKDYKNDDGTIITTNQADAEPYSVHSLIRKDESNSEEVSVYGVTDGSRYIQIPDLSNCAEDEVYISSSYAEKYDLAVGDSITLDEEYEEKQHTFYVSGIYDNSLGISVFMPIRHYRTTFDTDEEAFSGYLSDSEITDIDDAKIATIITERDITKMADQMDHSMGDYMSYFQYLCIILSAVLIYLLTKIIIEKNETSISMIKILGYENKEIFRLYLVSTTIMVVIIDIISSFLGMMIMTRLWKNIMMRYSGWFGFHTTPADYIKIFAFIMTGYLIVLYLDFKRIRKIKMDEALKDME